MAEVVFFKAFSIDFQCHSRLMCWANQDVGIRREELNVVDREDQDVVVAPAVLADPTWPQLHRLQVVCFQQILYFTLVQILIKSI